jgi:hypothetical protein
MGGKMDQETKKFVDDSLEKAKRIIKRIDLKTGKTRLELSDKINKLVITLEKK